MEIELDKAKLNFEIFGNSSNPPLVLWHGAGCTLRMWNNVIGKLEKHFFVVSFDIRGACKSINLDKDPKSYSFETYSDDLNEILQFLGIGKFHIWSMAWGTRAALAYSSLFPQKICSAVFSDASIGKADVEAQKSGLKDALKKQDAAGLRRHVMPKGWNEHLNSESAQLSLSAAVKFDFTKVIKNINFPFLVFQAVGPMQQGLQLKMVHEWSLFIWPQHQLILVLKLFVSLQAKILHMPHSWHIL